MINRDFGLLQGSWTVEDDTAEVIGSVASTEVVKRLDHGGWVYSVDCPISVPEQG